MFCFKNILIFILGSIFGMFFILTFLYVFSNEFIPIQKLYYSLPGSVVGTVALIWNVVNQEKIKMLSKLNDQRDYALASFDRYVGEPVRQAIDIIDELMSTIEEIQHSKKSGKDDTKAKLRIIIECGVTLKITKAYRLCAEADAYMKEINSSSRFEEHMYYVSDEEKLDDLIIINLNDAEQNKQPKIVLDAKIRKIETIITKKKAFIRSQLTKQANELAAAYH